MVQFPHYCWPLRTLCLSISSCKTPLLQPAAQFPVKGAAHYFALGAELTLPLAASHSAVKGRSVPWGSHKVETSKTTSSLNSKLMWHLNLQQTLQEYNCTYTLGALRKMGATWDVWKGEFQFRWENLDQHNHRSLAVGISQQYIYSLNHWHAHSRMRLHLFERGLCFWGRTVCIKLNCTDSHG